jgi:hypothetical protein
MGKHELERWGRNKLHLQRPARVVQGARRRWLAYSSVGIRSDRLVGMVDNVRVRSSEAGTFIEIDTAWGSITP